MLFSLFFRMSFLFLRFSHDFSYKHKKNNKQNIMDLWILHPSLILNDQIFLLLNY
jgi:ribosomal protein L20